MSALDPDDAKRLIKLLALLRSEFAGERASAGAKADEFVRAKNLTWADVIATSDSVPVHELGPSEVSDLIAFCLESFPVLNQWERGFLIGIKRLRHLSERQHQTLDGIARKCRAWRGVAA